MGKYEKSLEILNILHDNNFEGYLVGGFVKDKILNLNNDDIDICTNALPEDICKMFNVISLNGYEYGSLVIKHDNFEYEITTYRKDIEYPDFRHPVIEFSDKLEEDLLRRDFTINAILIDRIGRIKDEFNAVEDLNSKLIKVIGDPITRFKEDPIRIFRALYLVAKHNFDIEENTKKAIEKTVKYLENISFERITVELDKIINSKYNIRALEYIVKFKIDKYLPNLNLGINKFIKLNNIESLEMFYITSFYLNKYTDDNKLTKKDKTLYDNVHKVYEKIVNNRFTKKMLLEYEFAICNYAFKLYNIISDKIIYTSDELQKMYDALVITDKKQLKITFGDVNNVLRDHSDRFKSNDDPILVKCVYNNILNKVINLEIENCYEEIKQFIIEECL